METKNQPRIERGMIKLVVPHENKELTFVYPSFGPNHYRTVGKEILEKKYRIPTGDETASLLHSVYCIPEVNDEPEFQDIRNIMRNRWLWIFNRNLWTSRGVYVVQDTEAKGRSETFEENQLEEILKGWEEIKGVRFSKDKKARFAPKETYVLRQQTSKRLSENGFVIASYGIEGAEKLEEVSDKFRVNPYLYGLDLKEDNKSELRVSALGGYGGGLLVCGGFFGGCGGSRAFGVLQ